MNTSAPFMTSFSQQNIVDKQKAELYMQLYPYASEDFLSAWDATVYSDLIALHIENIHAQLETLAATLASHSHNIPPHAHANQGTSPQPLTTLAPIQAVNIKWTPSKCPVVFNTTLSSWNLIGNFKIIGIPSEGMLITSARRALPLPRTLTLALAPIFTAGIL